MSEQKAPAAQAALPKWVEEAIEARYADAATGKEANCARFGAALVLERLEKTRERDYSERAVTDRQLDGSDDRLFHNEGRESVRKEVLQDE